MLKDKFSKFFKKEEKKSVDKINLPIMDGFVDVKAYKVLDNGKKKLVYHDCGDNVVTDWMRHSIMIMLAGCSFTRNGKKLLSSSISIPEASRRDVNQFTTIGEKHDSAFNLDGYMLNGEQYFWDSKEFTSHYSSASEEYNKKSIYPVFPTKVLFGTGKEYSSWDELKTENEFTNNSWYLSMVEKFGGGETAKKTFNENISGENMKCNVYSATISRNIYSGEGVVIPTRTVNDPGTNNENKNIQVSSTMNRNFGVVGAVKTPYFSKAQDSSLLNSAISGSGKLLKPKYEGVGRPCFLYFNRPKPSEGDESVESWDQSNSQYYLSKDDDSKYLSRITYRIKMPAQGVGNNLVGEYYPYNGYTLKQIGLFNDSLLSCHVAAKSEDTGSNAYRNMMCGTLLAVKNITSFTKLADIEVNLTWTLTI